MTTDDQQLKQDAYLLGYLLVDIDRASTTRRPPPEARVTSPGFGPGDPLNVTTFSDGTEITTDLRAWCKTMRDHIDPDYRFQPDRAGNPPDGIALARWVAFRANLIATHPEGELLHDDIRRWNAQLIRIVGRGPDITAVANRPERRQSAKSLSARLSSMGHQVSVDVIRKWAERGHITRVDLPDGSGGYLATEALAYLGSRDA